MNQNSRGTRTSLPSDLPPSGDEEDLHSSPASGLAWSSNADEPLDYGPSVAPRAPYKPPVDEDDMDDEDERSIAFRRNGSARVQPEAGSRPVFRSASASADEDRPLRGRAAHSNLDPDEEAAYGLRDERPAREARSNREPRAAPSTPFKAASGVSALAEHPIAQQLLHNASSLPFVGGSVRNLMGKLGVATTSAATFGATQRLDRHAELDSGRELPALGESDDGSLPTEPGRKSWWKNKKVAIAAAVGVVVLWLASGSNEPSGTPVKVDGEHAKTMLAPNAPSNSEPLRAGMSLEGGSAPAAPAPAPVAVPVAAPVVASIAAPAASPSPAAASTSTPPAAAATPAVVPPWAGGMTLSPASSAAANAAGQALVGAPPVATPAPAIPTTPTPAPVAAVKAADPPPGAEDAKPAAAAAVPAAPLAASTAPAASAASAAKAASAAVAPAHQTVAKPAVKKAASTPVATKTAKQQKPSSGETQADREQVKALNQQLDQLLAK